VENARSYENDIRKSYSLQRLAAQLLVANTGSSEYPDAVGLVQLGSDIEALTAIGYAFVTIGSPHVTTTQISRHFILATYGQGPKLDPAGLVFVWCIYLNSIRLGVYDSC
jgi:hypothetical protein